MTIILSKPKRIRIIRTEILHPRKPEITHRLIAVKLSLKPIIITYSSDGDGKPQRLVPSHQVIWKTWARSRSASPCPKSRRLIQREAWWGRIQPFLRQLADCFIVIPSAGSRPVSGVETVPRSNCPSGLHLWPRRVSMVLDTLEMWEAIEKWIRTVMNGVSGEIGGRRMKDQGWDETGKQLFSDMLTVNVNQDTHS